MARTPSKLEAPFVIAEEDGLVTVRLAAPTDAAGKRGRAVGVRLRLKPPTKLLREDDHLHDQSVLPALLQAVPTVPGAVWTDTIVGVGRVTLSYGVKTAKEAKALQAVLQAVKLGKWKGWKVEEVIVDKANRQRLKRLQELADFDGWNHSTQHVTALKKVLAKLPQGSLATLAGLDGARPTKAKVLAALKWLDGQLATIEPAVLTAMKAKKGFELGLAFNMHPRFRQSDLRLAVAADPDETVYLSVEQSAVIEAHLGVTHEQLRRVAGLLWSTKVDELPGLTRLEVEMES